jgi:hypothetical protein
MVFRYKNKGPFLSLDKQIKDWRRAERKMGWKIFFNALQMFCSNRTLGLGIGNVDHDYPLFGIAEMATDFEKINK